MSLRTKNHLHFKGKEDEAEYLYMCVYVKYIYYVQYRKGLFSFHLKLSFSSSVFSICKHRLLATSLALS